MHDPGRKNENDRDYRARRRWLFRCPILCYFQSAGSFINTASHLNSYGCTIYARVLPFVETEKARGNKRISLRQLYCCFGCRYHNVAYCTICTLAETDPFYFPVL